MSEHLFDEEEALRVAVDNEIKGENLYSEFANRTKVDAVKKLFLYLAEQEVVHIEAIRKFQGNMNTNIDETELKERFENMTMDKAQQFFNRTIEHFDKQVKPDTDDMNARKTAMELEQSSYDFYKDAFEKMQNNNLKEFFTYLMEQESAHYTLIKNMFDFLQSPENFYAEEEKWAFEG